MVVVTCLIGSVGFYSAIGLLMCVFGRLCRLSAMRLTEMWLMTGIRRLLMTVGAFEGMRCGQLLLQLTVVMLTGRLLG